MIQPFFPSVQWKGPDSSVYLTYDDGPHPVCTSAVLKELNNRRVKATFFVIGKHALRYPGLIQEINSEGHAIGNHTFDHPLMLFRSPGDVRNQLIRTAQTVREVTGSPTTLFRPPYGYFGPTAYRVSRETGHRMVLWDVDTLDYWDADPFSVSQRTGIRTNPGSIVLFHDSEATKATAAETLNRYLDIVLSRALTLASLSK